MAKPRILFVEDEATLREHLARALSSDYCVDTAGSGTEALAAVMRAKPDLIVTDIVMPEMDGIELLKTLRAEPSTQHIPALLISGRAPEEQRVEGFREGADGYLAKPYSQQELRALIGAMLQSARQRWEAVRREAIAQVEQQALTERAVLLESITDAFYALDLDWRFIYANRKALDHYGKTRDDLIGQSIWEAFPAVRGTLMQEQYERALHTQASVTFEILSPISGRWLDTHVYPTGNGLAVYFRDVTERKRAEALSECQQLALRMLAEGASLTKILEFLLEQVEAHAESPLLGSIVPLNEAGTHFERGIGPSLPVAFNDAVQGIAVRSMSGICCHAVTQRAPVVAPDFAADPKWSRFAEFVAPYGLRAGWSTPIIGAGDCVLGTFGNYYRDARDPTPADLKWVEVVTRTAAIAIERHQAERHLRDLSSELKRTLDTAAIGLTRCSRDLRYLSANPAYAKLVGLPLDEIIGRPVRQVLGEHAFAAIDPYIKRVLDGECVEYETELSYVSGLVRHLQITYTPDRAAAGIVGWVASVTDVTERNVTEKKLRESELRFRMLADNISQLAWTCDDLGNVTWYNKRWLEYTGLSPEEMKGWGWSKVQHPDHLDRVVSGVKQSAETGEPWDDTFPLLGADGEYRWFLSRAVPIRDDQGNIALWFGTNTDITELREVREVLTQADRRKDEFLAMLAHELRNPLAPISNASEVLARTLTHDSGAQVAVGMIKRQVTHLTRIVDDLLDLSRITQGRIQLVRRPLDLAGVIAQAVETVGPQLREKHHRLTVLASSLEPLYVRGDFARLVQCVVNILVNAVKYTDRTGEISIRTREEDSTAIIEITDTGSGIAADLLPDIFEPFVQSDRTLDRAEGGLGIGLSVVKRLTEMHGGKVMARSPGAGLGSTFEIRLPQIERPLAQGEDVAEFKAPPRRVLVVDDNRDAANSLAMLLRMQGHEIQVANSGKEALAMIEFFHPHVALLDLGLPKMNGYELAGRLRALRSLSGIQLVAITGYGQPEDRERTKAAGFNDHLVKPVSLEALERALAGA